MAKVKFDIKSLEIPTAAKTPLYAGIGATDLAVTAVIDAVADVQKFVTETQKSVQKSVTGFEPKAVRDSAAKTVAERRKEIENRVAELQADALAVPTKVQSTVTTTYGDLAKRGEAVFKGTKTFSSASVEVKVNTTRPSTTKGTKTPAAKKAATTTKSTARSTAKKATTAKKTAAKKTATAKKSAASTAEKVAPSSTTTA